MTKKYDEQWRTTTGVMRREKLTLLNEQGELLIKQILKIPKKFMSNRITQFLDDCDPHTVKKRYSTFWSSINRQTTLAKVRFCFVLRDVWIYKWGYYFHFQFLVKNKYHALCALKTFAKILWGNNPWPVVKLFFYPDPILIHNSIYLIICYCSEYEWNICHLTLSKHQSII